MVSPPRRGLRGRIGRLLRTLASRQPLEDLRRLASERGQKRLMLLGIAEFVLAVAVDVSVDMWGGEPATIGGFGLLLCAAGLLCSLLCLPLVATLGGATLMKWLAEDPRLSAFLRRFAVVFVAGVATLGIYQAALWGVSSLAGIGDPFDVLHLPLAGVRAPTVFMGIGLLVVWPPFVYFWILTQVAATAVSIWVVTRLAAFTVTTTVGRADA
jgi:hypothetical protein